tara:strand:+ start:1525 stop:1767 length:243 start_codon:yes stop_codon:yes gene_type:complete
MCDNGITWAAAAIDIAWAFSAIGIAGSAAYAVRYIAETVATYFMVESAPDIDEVARAVAEVMFDTDDEDLERAGSDPTDV